MRVSIPALGILTASLLLAPSPASAGAPAPLRTLSESYDARSLDEVVFEIGIGEFELTGTDSDRIEVEVRIDCDDDAWGSGNCSDRAQEVSLESRERGGALEIYLDGTSSWRNRGMELEVRVLAPSTLATRVDMGIGELTVEGMTGDLMLDLGIGEVSVRGFEEMVGSVRLDVGTGEASLRGVALGRRESAGLFVRELSWSEGNGDARLEIDLGIGEIDVRLN